MSHRVFKYPKMNEYVIQLKYHCDKLHALEADRRVTLDGHVFEHTVHSQRCKNGGHFVCLLFGIGIYSSCELPIKKLTLEERVKRLEEAYDKN